MPETFYILTAEGGIRADLHGPYNSARSAVAAWAELHGAQNPKTDACFNLVLKDGALSLASGSWIAHEIPMRSARH